MEFFKDTVDVTFSGIDKTFSVSSVFCEFSVGSHNFSIKWYGVIIAFGFTLAVLFGGRMAYKWKMDLNKMLDILIFGTFGGIVGARLYYCLFKWDYYGAHPLEILEIWNGGLAIYGGIIGGVLAAFITAKIIKLNFLNLLDMASMSLLIGQGIGRWGNYANQEAFGCNTNGSFGMTSQKVSEYIISHQEELPGVDPFAPVHPTFFYESVWCVLGFFVLFFICKKFRKFSGQIALCYGVWYGIGRMFIEGLRTDSLYIPNTTIRVSQLLSAVLVVVCAATLIVFLIIRTKNPKPIEGVDYFIEPEPFFKSSKKEEKNDDNNKEEPGENAPSPDKSPEDDKKE